ncbi:DNA polymerase III subunit epsilon [Nocardioides cavernaquae]|uniref:DNA polymerase III subunit epsilon n=2 Tax=Nocardioides cavernaquae TaxID=2321396 RepID=A0A3A5HIJ4_9ACTN|nr:DNA polymerase III subunit epsilon [Nocardioides cavernaquae]
MSGFAVVDFETTGLFPNAHDRVVEVGLVLVGEDGRIEGEWSTIVDPGRDVGPTHIHGITARDVLGAPTFSQVLPRLLADLRGRVITTHNLSFDLRFLGAELRRAGVVLANPWVGGLCTMKWAGHLLRASSRKLGDCCDAAGIELANAHSALHDARAAAGLLGHLLRIGGSPAPWNDELVGAADVDWPQLPMDECLLVERGTQTVRRPSEWLDRVVARLPRGDDPGLEAYLEVLESALLDGYIAQYEEEALVETAVELGLSRSTLDDVHRDYLRSLARVALADGVVTDDERADLDRVAELVGLPTVEVDAALAMAPARSASAEFRLESGDVICLTGTMSRPRSEVERDLVDAGLVSGPLTKRTRLLVAADPDSASGKAKKARDYGVPIVHEAALMKLVRAMEPEQSPEHRSLRLV